MPLDPVVEEKKRKRRKLLALLLALVLLIVAAVVAWYLMTRKPLSQLPGVNVVAMPTHKTSLIGVEKPLGVAATPDGARILVSHGGAKAGVTVFDRDGRILRELEFPADVGLHVPVYLTIAPDGKAWIGDRAAGKVYVYTTDGDYVSTFQPKDAAIAFSPLGVAVDAAANVYVADVLSNDKASTASSSSIRRGR